MLKGTERSIGFDELKYLFFKKKKCPMCGNKMEKIESEEYKGIEQWMSGDGYKSDREVYEVKIFYYCRNCDKKYSLEELASGKK
ncbi:hypothetical protein [Clostridium saccharoperbutylacetonicum]|uniref:hypothetical protein n=1 Tax=Clostridium saccharoperbutylacetonicum TaxID=36745 RepID=UPI000983D585|nr:hypothetical protein [Clostridium saccharoperbutylacetonicum]AQR93136.1 hypothetical protein CLSAP_04130 [Clostridium saccharoperbutylacetonicum]NSB34548.1 uncharacterized protein with PIN domain [Clostridium saccharoperbutylacetonicum]